MKTLKQIELEILENESILLDIVKQRLDGGNKIRRRLEFLRLAKKAVEYSQVTRDSLLRQKEQVERYLKIEQERYEKWLNTDKNKELADPKKEYAILNGIDSSLLKKWKDELKFVNYLLQP